MTFGVDYAWGRPGATALKNAGVKFAARYLSHDATGKNLTHTEAKALSDAGIALVVVWETIAKRALAGRAAGVADATAAAKQALDCGMPGGRPIYFAVDFDASSSQEGAITAYLQGAATVLTKARVGIYGGYSPVAHALDGKHCAWGWQTYAWSATRWHSGAQLQQYSNDHIINGVGLDYDRSTVADFGQWRLGGSVTPPPVHDPHPTLRQGDTGPAVVQLQQRLNAHDHPGLKEDGDFGPLTDKAVRRFQQQHYLTVDGIVGPKTWAKLG